MALHVSAPYSRTVCTFELRILSLVFGEIDLELHTFLSMLKVPLALFILDMMPKSDPPALPTTLPKYVKDITSSRELPSILMGVLLQVF